MVLDWAFREAPRQKLALPLLETTLGAGTVRDTPTLTDLLTSFKSATVFLVKAIPVKEPC